MSPQDFFPLFGALYKKTFSRDHVFFADAHYDEVEKEKMKSLGQTFQHKLYLHLGLFTKDDQFVGFSFGVQESEESFYVICSAVDESFQKKGLYSMLLDEVIRFASDKGFQIIYGTHCATNNAVLIPKLKKGFIINKMELSDSFGVILHLSYFTNPLRRKVLDYRAGHRKPDEELKNIFKF